MDPLNEDQMKMIYPSKVPLELPQNGEAQGAGVEYGPSWNTYRNKEGLLSSG